MLDHWLVQGIIQNTVWALIVIAGGLLVAWMSTKSEKYATRGLYGLAAAVLTLFLIVQGKALYYSGSQPEEMTKDVAMDKSTVDWKAPPPVEVVNKTFENERVIIDGRSFVKCKFKNVTMVYNGTAPYRLYLPEWDGHISWQTDNPAIDGAVTILKHAMQRDPNFKFLVKP